MNYRHAFHAGNHGDCLKHALLVALLDALLAKDTPFGVADLHAGRGAYDLAGAEAVRTAEWRGGIARLLDDTPAPLARFVDLVRGLGLYPGSPAIALAMLRASDRLVANEKHPEEHAALAAWATGDARVTTRLGDAYLLHGVVPPAGMKRGLVLFDPPYEAEDEWQRLSAAMLAAHRAAPTLMLAAWYPVKGMASVRAFRTAIELLPKRLDATLLLRAPTDPARLAGSGMVIINAPWRFAQTVRPILEALLARLSDEAAGGSVAIEVSDG